MWIERLVVGSIAAFIGIVVIATVVYGVVGSRTHAACLAAGYREADIDYALNRYCVKRLDQTDIVVPFNQIAKD